MKRRPARPRLRSTVSTTNGMLSSTESVAAEVPISGADPAWRDQQKRAWIASMARREAFHQHVEGGLAGAVELPFASVFGDTAELRGHDRDCAAGRHETFEELNRAHRSERIGQHHVDEVALVHRGRRLLASLAKAGIDEEHVEAVPSEAFAQGTHGRRLDNIDRFDFEATRIAALQFAQIPRRTALRSNDLGITLEPLLGHRQTQPARGA